MTPDAPPQAEDASTMPAHSAHAATELPVDSESPPNPAFDIRFEVDPYTLRWALIWAATFLTLAGFLVEMADHLELPDPYDLVPFFGLSYEENLPTWYTSVLVFAAAIALTLISVTKRRIAGAYQAHWWVLSGIFYLISLDEIAQNHEQLSDFFELEGVLYFGWVIPAGIFVTLFGLSYLRFLLKLPRRFAIRIATAGAIYVCGALLMELPLGYWTEREGIHNLGYGMIDLLEESMEIVGMSLFLYTLVDYLATLTSPDLATPDAGEMDTANDPPPPDAQAALDEH